MSTASPAQTFDRPLLIGAAIVVALVAIFTQRQADPDMWGHLIYGRFFAEHGPGDHADPFAYTSAGQHWQAHEWLAQWLLWQAYALGGATGLLVLKWLVGGATLWFLCSAIRLGSAQAAVWAPVFILSAGMVGRWYVFRPQLFTYCLFAYFVFVLLVHLLGRRAWLWTLPPLLALWANLHGGFLAGLGAIGLVLGLRVVQTWCRAGWQPKAFVPAFGPLTLTLVLGLLATLLNPFGLDLWRYVATELTHNTNRLYNDEWMPLLRFDPHAWTILTVFLLLGALVLAGAFAQVARARVADIPAWVWLLACLPLTWMTFGSIRHVPILTLWTGPVLGLLAGAAAAHWRETVAWRACWRGLCAVVLVPTSLMVWFTLSNPVPRITVASAAFPCGAVDFMKKNQLHGNVYVALEWGSYLTWEMYPDVLVSMDGRNVTLFPSAMVRENFAYYLYDGVDPKAPLHYATDYLLLPVAAPVVQLLRQDADWQVLYEDKVAICFVRKDATHADVLRRHHAGEMMSPTATGCAQWFK